MDMLLARSSRSARRLSTLLLATALLAPALAAQAAPTTFLVTKFSDSIDGTCDSSDCSLREALIAANNNPGADTIIVPAGSYTLSIAGAGEDFAASGDLDIREALTISGSGTATIGVANGWDDRVIHVLPGVAATLGHLTIAGGKQAGGNGGGILNEGTLTFSDGTVSNNSAASGGGIANTGTLALWRTTVSNNASSGALGGGGIANAGTLTLYASSISGNSAPGGSGGGIVAAGATSIGASTIGGNSASAGGGLSLAATATITETTISSNSASGNGGGVYSSAPLTLAESTLSGNSASGNGGGIFNTGTLALTNATLSGNSATSGGGLANSGGATLASATIARNSASNGLGGGVLNGAGKSAALRNTLLAENSGATAPDCSGTLTSQGYNLVGVVAGACVVPAASGDKLNQEALLAGLANNGGPTRTHAPLAVSPALDAGNPATPGSGGNACPASDQRGVARPQTGRCDIGAFELPGVTIVDFAFQPANLVVQAGTTVRWKNTAATSHTTISDPNGFENWVSPLLGTGDVFLHTFGNNGSYNYHCSIHTGMTGKITVVGSSVPTTPLLSSISPNNAAAGSPELTLTLNGLNFDQSATVDWNGAALQISASSGEQIVAKVPAGLLASAGSASVRVVNPDQTGGASNALTFTITNVAKPTLDALSPASATAGSPAFTLTLLGSNFDAAATVDWNGTTLAPISAAASQITVQIPANLVASAGSASVKVVNPQAKGGESNTRTFTITNVGENPVPAITSISPRSAPVGSGPLTLTITGAGFVAGATVQFGNTTLTPSSIGSGQIVVSIPANLLDEVTTLSVSVTNPAPGGGLSNGVLFRVEQRYLAYLPLARR